MISGAEISGDDLLHGIQRLHFIGIGGSGMYPLVQILHEKNYIITGSDVAENDIIKKERALGIQVFIGHDAANINGCRMVVYSAAIKPDNPEIIAAEAAGIPCVERSVLLGYVAGRYKTSVCVSGTHGKTTCTGMITTLLEIAGKDPASVIGGRLSLIGGYGKAGSGDEIVVEACEYSRTFLKLTPSIAVILNIDNDHLDYYGTMENLKEAFFEFASMAENCVVANADDPNTMEVVKRLHGKTVTFGITDGDYRASAIRMYRPGFYECDVMHEDEFYAHIRLAVPGRHNLYNSLAMCACVPEFGLSPADAVKAVESFPGAGRRFEVIGEVNGATVVDDYGHHPAELRATLNAAKELRFKQIWAVHQPYTFSRTRILLHEFADALKSADHVILLPVMGGRETDDGSVESKDLAAEIPGSICVNGPEEAVRYLLSHAESGDLILTMGCGNVNIVAQELVTKGQTGVGRISHPAQTERSER